MLKLLKLLKHILVLDLFWSSPLLLGFFFFINKMLIYAYFRNIEKEFC